MGKATELRFYLHYPTLLKILVRFLSLFRLICVAMLAQRAQGPPGPRRGKERIEADAAGGVGGRSKV